jgi:hypothetical protein
MPKMPSPQVEEVNLRIDSTRHCVHPWVERLVDRVGYGPGDFVLQRKHVRQFTIITFRPEIFIGLRPNEPRRNAHPVACAEDRSFND